MENKQSGSSPPRGFCQKLFDVLCFRHSSPPASQPPPLAVAKKSSSLPPPGPLSYAGSTVALPLQEPSSVTKHEKEKQPITKMIEVTSPSPPVAVTRKQITKEGRNAEAAAPPHGGVKDSGKPKDIDEQVEAFLKRARLKIRALSGVNEGKPST